MTDLLPEGRYMATVTEAVLGKTKAGKPQVAIGFALTAPESAAGRNLTYYGSLSSTVISTGKNEGKRVAELTLDALEACGWDGENLEASSLNTAVGGDVSLVVAIEAGDDGVDRNRVKFVNSPNSGGAAIKERATDAEAANVSRQLGGLLAKRKQQRQARERANGTQPKPAQRFDDPDDFHANMAEDDFEF